MEFGREYSDLLREAENVGVVLREAAHAEQSRQRAGALVAVHSAELGHAQGEVPVECFVWSFDALECVCMSQYMRLYASCAPSKGA